MTSVPDAVCRHRRAAGGPHAGGPLPPWAISPWSATKLHSALGLKVRTRARRPSQAEAVLQDFERTLAPGCLGLLPRWLPKKSPAPAASIDTRSRKATAPPRTSVAQPKMQRSRRTRRVMGRKLPSRSRALVLCAAGQLLAGSATAATVISVGDGDTLQVADHGKTITIQMAFSDAPEMAQAPYGQPVAEQSSGLSPQVLEWIKQANAFESQGAYGKAAELMEKVLSFCEKTHGPDHPDTALTRDLLEQCRKALSKRDSGD